MLNKIDQIEMHIDLFCQQWMYSAGFSSQQLIFVLFQVLVYLKGFSEGDRVRLARCIAMWMSDSLLDPKVLATLLQDHLIKDGLAADFLCEVSWQMLIH